MAFGIRALALVLGVALRIAETIQRTAVAMTLGWHVADLEGTRFFYKEGFIP